MPVAVVDHVRRCLELADGTAPVCGTPTAKLHRTLVRERLGVICDPQRAREVAEEAIRAAALVKNHPPDLINVALEMLVKSSLELLAEMFCKRMASITKLAKAELDEIRERQAEMSERLISTYRGVLSCLDPRSDGGAGQALRLARTTVERAGGFDAQLADIEAVAAHHANNYMPLMPAIVGATARRCSRSSASLSWRPRAADRSVLAAVEHALAHAHLIRDHIPDHLDGAVVDVSFASEQWQRIIRDRGHPGRLNRRHFEACVFTYLAAELRSGDIAVRGSEAYANWSARLLPRGLRGAAR